MSYLNRRLKKGGTFIFDISSEYKLSEILGNNVFGQSFEDMIYLWENEYDEEKKQVEMTITLMEQEGMLYRRMQEKQTQRAYSIKEMTTILQETGYREVFVYGDLDKEQKDLDFAERLFFVAVK